MTAATTAPLFLIFLVTTPFPLAKAGNETAKEPVVVNGEGRGTGTIRVVGLPSVVCFSSSSHVTLATGNKVSVSSLSLGDEVMTLDHEGKEITTPFLGWIHRESGVTTNFLKMVTESQAMISLSPDHLLMSIKQGDTMPSMQLAHKVEEGDYLISKDLKKEKVEAITSEELTGLWAPSTSTGTLLVDGLLASCYAHTTSQSMAHLWFMPVQWLGGLDTKETEKQDGMRTYSSLGLKVGEMLGLLTKSSNDKGHLSIEEPDCVASTSMEVFWRDISPLKVQ